MGILSFLGNALKPIFGFVDDLHTSDEERLQARIILKQLENALKAEMLELEGKLIQAQTTVIVAEAKSQSWIARNWRPIVMLTFAAEIVLISTGWMDVAALQAVPDQLWSLLTLGIGGYMALRSFDKAAPGFIEKMGKKRDLS